MFAAEPALPGITYLVSPVMPIVHKIGAAHVYEPL